MSLEGCVSNIGDELNVMQKKYNILCGSRAFKYLADICTNNRLTNKPVVWNLLKNANWPLQFLKFCRTIGSKNATDYRNQIEFGRKTKQKFKIGTCSVLLQLLDIVFNFLIFVFVVIAVSNVTHLFEFDFLSFTFQEFNYIWYKDDIIENKTIWPMGEDLFKMKLPMPNGSKVDITKYLT